MMYEDETKVLTVQFNNKSIYTYFDVEFDDFMNISGGNAVCKTSGSNRFGTWFVGKTPSTGAAIHKYLIERNVRFKKGGSLR